MNNKIEIDTGVSIITLSSEKMRIGGVVFTAYANNISVRSNSLHLRRIRDTFVKSALQAAEVFRSDSKFPREEEVVRSMKSFITSALKSEDIVYEAD